MIKEKIKFAYIPTKTISGWIWFCNYKATYIFEYTDKWVNDGTRESFGLGYEIPNMKKVVEKDWVIKKKEVA